MIDAYARAGVDTARAHEAVSGLVRVLRTIKTPSRSVLDPGHYASVLKIAEGLGVALSTDGVGSKVVIAEHLRRFDTIGQDCVAMNVNDVLCVGAEPIALLDYIAVQEADPVMLESIGVGLKRGAEQACIEIPGGELAQLPEVIRGHPKPYGFDLNGTCIGLVRLESLITGERCTPGDRIIGLPSSGIHANGLTLARQALVEDGGYSLDDQPTVLAGESIAEALLEPTWIYVRTIMKLLRSDVPVHGLAHITSDGMLNLKRLSTDVGYAIDEPLPILPIFQLIQRAGDVDPVEMQVVFNMGCGFCCVVPQTAVDGALSILQADYPGAAVVGRVVDSPNLVRVGDLELSPARARAGEEVA